MLASTSQTLALCIFLSKSSLFCTRFWQSIRDAVCSYTLLRAAKRRLATLSVPRGPNSLLAKRLVKHRRKAHAGLAQLLGNVVRGGRDVLVGQAVAVACRELRKLSKG